LGEKIRIIINSPTDTVEIINQFKIFYDSNFNGNGYNLLISSVRDDNFWPRKDFFRIMEIPSGHDYILEIPLAKITRRGENFHTALNWYSNKIDALIDDILINSPFNI